MSNLLRFSAYLFLCVSLNTFSYSVINETAKIEPPIDTSFFGYSVSIHGDRLIVGSGELAPGSVQYPHRSYTFERTNNEWIHQQTGGIGSEVAISNDFYFAGHLGEFGDAAINGSDQVLSSSFSCNVTYKNLQDNQESQISSSNMAGIQICSGVTISESYISVGAPIDLSLIHI